ncbi:hypothetical protein G6L28_16615 [Agrobacterium larrymoorei]|uniref:hypothetical protein n=1 Tax=Agrobacterium larrymoorei TaxID=160699 RepID=UPI0015720623|nr:hypothetical protein [Agrobacterium larrymoorei]NTJ44224.1 hypothetical protein [Agrobacterium larrymoorei]
MVYRLATLGRCVLEQRDGQVLGAPTASLLIAAYLYDIGTSVARRDLASLFWPGNQEAAATNLRSTLRRLAKATEHLGQPLLLQEGNIVRLNTEAVECDLAFRSISDAMLRLEAATDAVARQFLPSMGEGKTAVDIWVRDVRVRLLSSLRSYVMEVDSDPELRERGATPLKRAAVILLEANPHDDEIRKSVSRPAHPNGAGASLVYAEATATGMPKFEHTTQSDLVLPRLALLPPDTLKDAKSGGSVANALIEDLTISLCSNKLVSIVAPYTSERIQASKDKALMLEKHRVVYALDSRRYDDQLFVQLIFMPTDEIIWAARFQLAPAAVAAQRIEIVQVIQDVLTARIGAHQRAVGDFVRRPEAYFLYLKGSQNLSTISLPSLRRARKHFREALDHGKDFSAALAGISRTLTMEWILTARGDADLLAKAEQFAERAIDEDQSFSTGYKELGVSRLYMGKIDESLDALGQAEELSPQYADVLCSHADSLIHGSNPQNALSKIRHAIDLNPISPDTYYWTAAGASYFLQEYEQATGYIDRMKDKRPASRLAAASWAMLGDQDKARSYRMKVMEDNPDFDLDRWLQLIPHKEAWQTQLYREGLVRAGFGKGVSLV